MIALRLSFAAMLAAFDFAGAALGETARETAPWHGDSPPLGLPHVPIPAANPITATKIALGRQLFLDARLSANARFSCASCHDPREAFTQTTAATPSGASGKPLPRNAPTLLNVAYMSRLMQDGEAHSLEAQVLSPLFATEEMANPSIAAFVSRVSDLPEYKGRFVIAFGESATMWNIAKAIASYERTLLSGNSPFDRWRFGGQGAALREGAKAGFALFTGKAGCVSCHAIGDADALFTDQGFHNTGIGVRADKQRAADRPADLGREMATHDPLDRFKYRTPTLRNVARTGPYMHDGSLTSLREVVAFYNAGGAPNPGLDPLVRPLDLSESEISNLVALLESLTGDNVDDLANETPAVRGTGTD